LTIFDRILWRWKFYAVGALIGIPLGLLAALIAWGLRRQ